MKRALEGEQQVPAEVLGSKRERKTRLVLVGGNAVLKANNYSMDETSADPNNLGLTATGVNVWGLDETYHLEIGEVGGSYVYDPQTGEQIYINTSGRPVNVAQERARAARAAAPKKTTQVRKVDEVAQRHAAALRVSKEQSDRNRLVFVARNVECFRQFLSPSFLAKALATAIPRTSPLAKQYDVTKQLTFMDDQLKMRPYQIDGVNFLLRMQHQGMSAILADEMGLGKTAQTIAFLGALKFDLKIGGPHLVVVPMSVLSNWCSEFRRFCPTLTIKRFHSTSAEQKSLLRKSIIEDSAKGELDVIVTTYDMLLSEKASGIAAMRFRYLILDEAHKVKNSDALVSNACRRVTRELSLFLTGTPLQNNLKECWCLLNCLQADIFSRSDEFEQAFDASDLTKLDTKLVDAVWKLLPLFLLRRKKADVNIELPPKAEVRLLVPLSPMQSFWYRRILVMNAHMLARGQIDDQADAPSSSSAAAAAAAPAAPSVPSGESGDKKLKLSNLMMQLRKISSHPFLFPQIEDLKEVNYLHDYREASGKLHMLERLLSWLKKRGHRAVVFSQFTRMLDIVEDFLTMLGYRFVRLDGSTNRIQRMISISQFNQPNSPIDVFILSTRAGGLGVNLQTADTCILMDSDWNPQADCQAMGRVHRIGQTKPVTIFRLVSAGTVEERIVARATRKLLLDEMVSEGTEKMIASAAAGGGGGRTSPTNDDADGDEPADQGVGESDMRKALLFSMKKMFKKNGGVASRQLDDETEGDPTSAEKLDRIIESTLEASPLTAAFASATAAPAAAAVAPMDQDDYDSDYDSDEDAEEEEDDVVGVGEEENEGADRCMSLTADAVKIREFKGEDLSLSTIFAGKSLWDIREEWAQRQLVQEGKREQVSRTVEVDGGVGVGKVKVLRQNMYSLQDGEPTISKPKAFTEEKSKRLLKAGRDYFNFDFCQSCGGSDGELVLCDSCPVSVHITCLSKKDKEELKSRSALKRFQCAHHSCAKCEGKSVQVGNLLLRCLGCSHAFCEDCVVLEGPDAVVVFAEQPPQQMQNVGFIRCNQACYVTCTKECETVINETTFTAFGYPPGCRAPARPIVKGPRPATLGQSKKKKRTVSKPRGAKDPAAIIAASVTAAAAAAAAAAGTA